MKVLLRFYCIPTIGFQFLGYHHHISVDAALQQLLVQYPSIMPSVEGRALRLGLETIVPLDLHAHDLR